MGTSSKRPGEGLRLKNICGREGGGLNRYKKERREKRERGGEKVNKTRKDFHGVKMGMSLQGEVDQGERTRNRTPTA